MIKRQNILSLIEEGGSRYHSCIITTYSFDFTFFEYRILPKLRNKGINNINLFIDSKMLEFKLIEPIHFISNAKKTYSVNRISMPGAFHPKIILAVGKKEGLLAIGSGNITSSGISSNDEIWSAFHIDELNQTHSNIFKEISEFLSPLINQCRGKNREKINWIIENSEWYKSLINNEQYYDTKVNSIEEYIPVYSNVKSSLFESLKQHITPGLKNIKIISPYYNSNGFLLNKLMEEFKPDSISCIIDSLNGSIPNNLENKYGVNFSDWESIDFLDRKKNNRLHAKAFQFEYSDKTYFLCGSANATKEAFGIDEKQGVNSEMSVLIKSKVKRDFFNDLGIMFPSEGNTKIENHNPNATPDSFTVEKKEFEINYCELDDNELFVVFSTIHTGISNIALYAPNGKKIAEIENQHIEKEIKLELKGIDLDDIFKVALVKQNNLVSNYCIVHHSSHLDKSNPDEKLSKLLTIINQQDYGDAELEGILEFIDTGDATSKVKIRRTQNKSKKTSDEELNSDAITEEEFEIAASQYHVEDVIFNKQNSLVEDYLYNALINKYRSKDDVSESPESKAKENEDSEGEEDLEVKLYLRTLPNYDIGINLKKSVNRILNKISDVLYAENKKSTESVSKNTKANLFDQLYLALIASHILLYKLTDKFEEKRHIFTILRNSRKPLNVDDEDDRKGKGPIINSIEKTRALYVLERDFSLIKSINQGEVINQITYSVGSTHASKLSTVLGYNLLSGERIKSQNQNEYFKLISIDKTPSLTILHSYFDELKIDKEIPVKKLSGSQKFVILGIGSYLKLKLVFQTEFEGKRQQKWEKYNSRLFYRTVLITIIFKFSKELNHLKKLLLLNIFHVLGNGETSVEEFSKNIRKRVITLRLEEYVLNDTLTQLFNLYENYLRWCNTYDQTPSDLKEDLSKNLINKIVFSKSRGFGIARGIKDNLIQIETPLGIENERYIGIKDIYIGLNPTLFK